MHSESSSLLGMERGLHEHKYTKSGQGKFAILFLVLTTLTFVASMCTPWFWVFREGLDKESTNCFIDGTCRMAGRVFKDNGDTQKIYDTTLILMLISWVPFVTFFHMILFMYSRRYENSPLWRFLGVLTGILTFILIFIAILVFSLGVPANSVYDDLFGETRNPVNGMKIKWGANAGWFLAIFTLIFLVPTIFLTCTMKNKRKLEKHSTIIVQPPTTLSSTSTATH